MTTSTGTMTLSPPTVDITHTGQEEVLDGVRIVFQLTPGTEAPAEMNFLFPDHRALCLAENATHNMHNILTLRGAVVRDARVWSRYLDEAASCSGTRRTSPSRHTTGPPGAGRTYGTSSPPSGTCTRTSTTRPCGCSTPG